ncbi:helix-hairpin-helix domain-containing protein [Bacillus sp. B1-b2]|uniref:helix-hairpin-helix domain-containing protein n=1 Tax=Bacillus sp. B1-b2 TaxID=2653201 RepID=UPI001D01778A|nr:helix-hairpin-helix domain-containing protein [Bacillus sp. B1-b2]
MSQLKKHKKILIIIGIGIFLFICSQLYLHMEQEKVKEENLSFEETLYGAEEKGEEPEVIVETETSTEIVVDIKGAVNYPGVYEMTTSDRVHDAIKKAGGIVEEGDDSVINFAMKLTDEMVIYVPLKGEEGIESLLTPEQNLHEKNEEGVININTADESQLQEIPGIGPSKARAIIDYREKNGVFSEKEDLKKVSGIGDKTYEKLENSITI